MAHLKNGMESAGKQLSAFKKFISRGNVIDMAIGVIIGGAFGKIVSSLVNDLIMPLIGIAVGKIDFSKLSLKVGQAEIKYGNFIQTVMDFIIISFCIFIMIKIFESFKKKQEETNANETPAVIKSDEVLILEEIRDLLKDSNR